MPSKVVASYTRVSPHDQLRLPEPSQEGAPIEVAKSRLARHDIRSGGGSVPWMDGPHPNAHEPWARRANEPPCIYSRRETRHSSPSNRASRAIWAPGHACSAVRGDSRRTTLWLALAMPRKPWPGLRWKIEPFPSFSPFHYPPIHVPLSVFQTII